MMQRQEQERQRQSLHRRAVMVVVATVGVRLRRQYRKDGRRCLNQLLLHQLQLRP